MNNSVSCKVPPLPSSPSLFEGSSYRQSNDSFSSHRFLFISSCCEAWGGSEELWAGAAAHLAKQGHFVSAMKRRVDVSHPGIQRLQELSCPVLDLKPLQSKGRRALEKCLPDKWKSDPAQKRLKALSVGTGAERPDLVIISQGENFDGFRYALLCGKLGLPYVIISQKAMNHYWPSDAIREHVRIALTGAQKCYFVSRHNHKLTEDQIGMELKGAEVVRNPFLVPYDRPLPWPEHEEKTWRLACVGRLYVFDKGQDMLLRVLSRQKWKERDLHVYFYGRGINQRSLLALVQHLELKNVSFCGFTTEVTQIWRDNHALILPSRAEGLPLALVEAMLCGRPAIVTNVGGNSEVLEDEKTGFLVAAPTEQHLDETLERAWQQRNRWREIGLDAHTAIRELVPPNPIEIFADHLTQLVNVVQHR